MMSERLLGSLIIAQTQMGWGVLVAGDRGAARSLRKYFKLRTRAEPIWSSATWAVLSRFIATRETFNTCVP